MDNAKFIHEGDVRKVIEDSTYTTTLKDLEKRGKNKVRVVKARQIYRLIAEAVNQVIGKSSFEMAEEQRERLIDESKKELDRILSEHNKEDETFREQQRKIEKHLRRELEAALERVAALRSENDELRNGMREAAVAPAPAAAPAPAPVDPEFMQQMLQQMADLRSGFQDLREARVDSAAPDGSELLRVMEERESKFADRFQNVFDDAIQKFSTQVDERLEKKDAAMAAEHVEAAEVALDSLFAGKDSGDGIESNLSRVGVETKDAGGIGSNLARLRSMARKPVEKDESGD